jgi:hypothetical protein
MKYQPSYGGLRLKKPLRPVGEEMFGFREAETKHLLPIQIEMGVKYSSLSGRLVRIVKKGAKDGI